MKFIFFIFFFLVSKYNFSQSFSSHPISLTPEKKTTTLFNDSLFKVRLNDRYKNEFKYENRLEEFKEINTQAAKDQFYSNEVYSNLTAETQYVNRVFKATIPIEYLSDNLKVYIVRDPSVNAYCREDGAVFVNIGLLSILDNEAELAAVLSHEFGHYYLSHSLKGYKKAKNTNALNVGLYFLGPYGTLPSLLSIGKFYGDKRAQEKESDMFTIKFFKQNMFSASAILSIQNKFLQYSSNSKKRQGYSKSYALFNTHPSSQKRISYLKDSILVNKLEDKNYFLVDSAFFKKIKRRAIDEVIYLNFFQANLNDCIERAYLQHLYFPKDEFYIYFILESLRRKLNLFPSSRNDYFITSQFKSDHLNSTLIDKSIVSSIPSSRIEKSIQYNLKTVYEFEFKNDIKSLTEYNELLDTTNVEFITNADALKYFTAVALKTNYKWYPILKNKTPIKEVGELEKSELEKTLYAQTFLSKSHPDAGYKTISYPFFFNNYYTSTRGEKKYYKSAINNFSYFYKDFLEKNPISQRDTNFNTDVFIFPELDLRDTYQNTWLDYVSIKVIEDSWPDKTKIKKKYFFSDSKQVLRTKLDFESDLPELYIMSKKYGYKKLYFADVLDNEGDNHLFYKPQIGLLVYSVDFSTGTVERYCFKYKRRYQYWGKASDNYYNMARSLSDVVEKTK